MHDLGLAVSYTSVIKKKKDLVKKQEQSVNSVVQGFKNKCAVKPGTIPEQVSTATESSENQQIDNPGEECVSSPKSIEILGDNFDITIAPSHMSIEKQRKSLHWFLTMVKEIRVTYEHLNLPTPIPRQQPILEIPSHTWVPSVAQIESVEQNFIFHISKVLLKYLEFLQPVKDAYPVYIDHPFTEITKEKSIILNSDLIDASENSTQGMINILQKVHELAVPHVDGRVEQKLVFGGDVLTNERAFSAQQAMQNGDTEFHCLFGIVHRPEGLHREFNFLLVIRS